MRGIQTTCRYRRRGLAGEDGHVYDHIVEQSQEGKSGFSREDSMFSAAS
ncbi:MAG: hypothetical protein IJO71_11845 [Microbacterium sp.]|jgi:hypothetical protein|nr:hypothetical protein [Microbacterium sp.]MBQ9917875.1 hypothetical protein [Microbacterium sp.]